MIRFVLDCSVTISWCFSDETDDYAEDVLDLLSEAHALVPSIWPLEVANVLLVAERRQRLSEAQTVRLVELLRALPITVDVSTAERAMEAILPLARDHGLSAYDAAYLELAMREGLPLATRDKELMSAARRSGLPLLLKTRS